jgi:hypothetical protein
VPQLPLFVVVSTQLPPQTEKGAAQTQTEPTQVRFPPQISPQKPQLVLLLVRSTQSAPQRVSPGRH